MAIVNFESGEEPRNPKPLSRSIQDFFQSPDLLQDMYTFQRIQKEDGHEAPEDIMLAKQLVSIGQHHIKSVLQNYPYGTSVLSHDITPEHSKSLSQSVAAVIFGISYQHLSYFLNENPLENDRTYSFDNDAFLSEFDEAMRGTYTDRYTVFKKENPQPRSYESFDSASMYQFTQASKFHGVASLFQVWNWIKLPKVMQLLADGFSEKSNLISIAQQFQKILTELKGTNNTQSVSTRRDTPILPKERENLERLFGDFDPLQGFE